MVETRRNRLEVPANLLRMIKRPSAFVPVAMSLAALATVLFHVAKFGVVREPDEGTAAHIWQLLMAGQMPIIAFFAIKWLPRAPKETLAVLAPQIGAVLAALAPVFLLKL
jgi:hypothetical protein